MLLVIGFVLTLMVMSVLWSVVPTDAWGGGAWAAVSCGTMFVVLLVLVVLRNASRARTAMMMAGGPIDPAVENARHAEAAADSIMANALRAGVTEVAVDVPLAGTPQVRYIGGETDRVPVVGEFELRCAAEHLRSRAGLAPCALDGGGKGTMVVMSAEGERVVAIAVTPCDGGGSTITVDLRKSTTPVRE
jgi:hypothetical protein